MAKSFSGEKCLMAEEKKEINKSKEEISQNPVISEEKKELIFWIF
mgnify:CR=1 FL=1